MLKIRCLIHALLVCQTSYAFPITSRPKRRNNICISHFKSCTLHAPYAKNRKSSTFCALSTEDNNNDNNSNNAPSFVGSLELLALVVSMFFIATVSLGGDKIFAAPQPVTSLVIDADAVLREDFERVLNSADF